MAKKKIPLYQQIYNALRADILEERFKPGDAFPSERALRERFQTSHLTIRKALARLVSENYIERRPGIGTQVTYRANQYAATGERPRIAHLAIILEEIDRYFARILNLLERECQRRQIHPVCFCHRQDSKTEQTVYEEAGTIRDALILLEPAGRSVDWLAFHPNLSRTIVMDAYFEELPIPQVLTDDIRGGYLATKHLADMGHRQIAHISSETKLTGSLRKKGYLQALEESGIASDESLIENGAYSVEGGYHACLRILERHAECSAFFCANDASAFGAMKCLRERGRLPGRDFSIVGYGDYPLASVMDLSSVDQEPERVARQIMYLIGQYESTGRLHPGLYRTDVSLRLRGSIAAPNGAQRNDRMLV